MLYKESSTCGYRDPGMTTGEAVNSSKEAARPADMNVEKQNYFG